MSTSPIKPVNISTMKVIMGLSSLQRALAPIFVLHLEYRKNAILVSMVEMCRHLFAKCYFAIAAVRFLLLLVLKIGSRRPRRCILCAKVACGIGEVFGMGDAPRDLSRNSSCRGRNIQKVKLCKGELQRCASTLRT